MGNHNGFLVRTNLSDTGDVPRIGQYTRSPDVICYRDGLLSVKDASDKYGIYLDRGFLQHGTNNIYVRAKNISSGSLSGKARLYHAPFNVLLIPGRWSPVTTVSGDEVVNLVGIDGNNTVVRSVPQNSVALTEQAFQLKSVSMAKTNHHCLLGLTALENEKFIDFPERFTTNNEAWEFVQQNPQLGQNNISIQQLDSRVAQLGIDFGNHNDVSGEFIMNVTPLTGGLSLIGSEIMIQSTDQSNMFTHKAVFNKDNKDYSFMNMISGKFAGTLNFCITMPNYKAVDAMLYVQYYVINSVHNEMPHNVRYRTKSNKEGTAAIMGDCCIRLVYDQPSVEQIGTRIKNAFAALDVKSKSPMDMKTLMIED